MNDSDIYPALNELFRELFDDNSIVLTPETTADDIAEWDSFMHLNIIVAVEKRFGIKLTTREIEGLNKIGDMVKTIHLKATS